MSKRTSLKARSSSIEAAMTAAHSVDQSRGKRAAAGKAGVHSGGLVGLSVRLTPKTHDDLRKIAFDRRVSIHSLLLEGVEFVIRKHSSQ